MAKLIIVSIVALAVIVSGAIFSEAVSFKKDILTQQMPSLLAGLLAVATITERATAVLNNIWFGRSRVEAQDGVRLANRKVQAAEKKATLAQAAIQSPNISTIVSANATVLDVSANIPALVAEVKSSEDQLTSVQQSEINWQLALSFLIALVVSALGVRTLETLLDIQDSGNGTSSEWLHSFRAVDIVLTAGVLTGGTSGISAITDVLSTYVNATRKRALQ